MGNSWERDRQNNVLRICHDVPGLKMKGFYQPPLPYELRNFTVGGWGAITTGKNLAITGERKIQSEGENTRYHRREREAGRFSRIVVRTVSTISRRSGDNSARYSSTVVASERIGLSPSTG